MVDLDELEAQRKDIKKDPRDKKITWKTELQKRVLTIVGPGTQQGFNHGFC
jgi:hypothetical protein